MKHEAKEGYVWKLKDSEDLMSNILYLGVHDAIDRYEQVPKSIEENEV